jgi:integrase
MGSKFNFTTERIGKLVCPVGKDREYYFDAATPALTVCVTAVGTKTFYLYRRVQGRPARIKLGRYPEIGLHQARQDAQRANGDVARGLDPQAAKRNLRDETTFSELFEHWMAHAKLHKKTWASDQRLYNCYLAGWKSRKLSQITKADVQSLHGKMGTANGRYMANRVLALVSAMFGKATDLEPGILNPAENVTRFKEKSRERFLQGDELPRFFQSLRQEPDRVLRDFFAVALFTGARRGNVLAMAWADVHLERGTWVIPDTKSGDALTIPLAPEVVEVLEARQANGSPWVFPGRGKSGHLEEPKIAWARLLARAGIADLRIHDLRRTLGSWQAAVGSSLQVIGKSLGHKNQSTTAIYARLNLDPVRQSVGAAAAAIRAAANAKGSRRGKR